MYAEVGPSGLDAKNKSDVSLTERQCVVKIVGFGCTLRLDHGPAPVLTEGGSSGETCREFKWTHPLARNLRTLFKWLDRRELLQARCSFSLMLATFLRCTGLEQREFKCVVASSSTHGVSTSSGRCLDGNFMKETEIRFGSSAGDQGLFVDVMGVFFRNVALHESLMSECNIYRLTECVRSGCIGHDFYNAYAAMLLVFVTQLLLTSYVVANIGSQIMEQAYLDVKFKHIPLSIVVAALSVLMMKPGMRTACTMLSEFWVSTGSKSGYTLKWADGLCNIIMPVILVPAGFLLILFSDTLMAQVLNSVALLFIPFLDDELVPLLQLNVSDLVEGFIQQKALAEFNAITQKTCGLGIEVSSSEYELMKTTTEDGSLGGLHYIVLAPGSFLIEQKLELHLRRFARRADGQILVCLSNTVDADCLFERIEWQNYTWATSTDSQGILDPCIVRLWKLGDLAPLEIVCPSYDSEKTSEQPVQVLKGIFVIVDFEMSNWIQRLRILASPTCTAFRSSMEHFSIWDIHSSATALLDKYT